MTDVTQKWDNHPENEIFKNIYHIRDGKSKAISLQAWTGPDFLTTAQDDGKVVSLTHRPRLPPGNTPGTHFC